MSGHITADYSAELFWNQGEPMKLKFEAKSCWTCRVHGDTHRAQLINIEEIGKESGE